MRKKRNNIRPSKKTGLVIRKSTLPHVIFWTPARQRLSWLLAGGALAASEARLVHAEKISRHTTHTLTHVLLHMHTHTYTQSCHPSATTRRCSRVWQTRYLLGLCPARVDCFLVEHIQQRAAPNHTRCPALHSAHYFCE